MTSPLVLCVGDLVADVRLAPSEGPVPGEEVTGSIELHGGGSAANVAAWIAFAGGRARFAGRVGRDPLGDLLVGELAAAGVDVHAARDPAHRTGLVAALIDRAGERALVSSPGASAHLDARDVRDDAWDGVAAAFVSAYCLTRPSSAPAGRAVIAGARDRGVPFGVDPAAARLFDAHPGRAELLAWTAGAAWCFPSEPEARALGRARSAEDAAVALLEHYRGVAVTTGATGCVLATRARPAPERVPASRPPGRVVDATGAGDAFAAGFARAWAEGADPGAAAGAGVRLAALAVTLPGARPPRP